MPDGLRGKQVLVTRATGQNTKLSQQLASVGAVPVEFPTIRIGPPADPTLLNISSKTGITKMRMIERTMMAMATTTAG